jgi:hypothetical protein
VTKAGLRLKPVSWALGRFEPDLSKKSDLKTIPGPCAMKGVAGQAFTGMCEGLFLGVRPMVRVDRVNSFAAGSWKLPAYHSHILQP